MSQKIITSNFVGQLWPSDDDDDDNDHWWDFEIPSIIIAEKNHMMRVYLQANVVIDDDDIDIF